MSNIVLSEKLTLQIFSYLDINSLYRATQVCTLWKPFAENLLFKLLVSKYFPKTCTVNNEHTNWKRTFIYLNSYSINSFITGDFNYFYMNTKLKNSIFQIEFDGSCFRVKFLDSDSSSSGKEITVKGKVLNTYFVQKNEWAILNKDVKGCIFEERNFIIQKGQNLKIVKAHSTDIKKLIASKDFFFTTSGEKTIQVWDMEGNNVKQLVHEHNTGSVLVSIPNTPFLVTSSQVPNIDVEMYNLHLWDVQKSECLKTLQIPATGEKHSCVFEEGFLFVGIYGGCVLMYDSDFNLIRQFRSEKTYSIISIDVSKKWVVASDLFGYIHCWSLKEDAIMSESVEKINNRFKRLKIV